MDTLKIYEELREALGEEPARAIARVIGDLYSSELLRLRETVEGLMESHKQAIERFDRMEKGFEELRETLRELAVKVDRLTEAQRRTEEEVENLAEAQRKTEEELKALAVRVDELAEAQRKTEEELRRLARAQREIRSQLGGLAHTVGYRLEDEAIKSLPALLKRDLGVEIVGRLTRDYVEIAPGRYVEVNIFGKAVGDGEELVIIGEAKSQLRKRDVDGFIKKCERLSQVLGPAQLRILVAYQAPPQVRRYVEEKGIKLYFSYEL